LGELKEMVLISKATGNTKNGIAAFFEFQKVESNDHESILQSIEQGALKAANAEYQKKEQPTGMKVQHEPLGSNTSGKSLKDASKRYERVKTEKSTKIESNKKRKASEGTPESASTSNHAKDSSALKTKKKKMK
jgi:hypothetical protein